MKYIFLDSQTHRDPISNLDIRLLRTGAMTRMDGRKNEDKYLPYKVGCAKNNSN